MIKFFRHIRQQLLADSKFSRYLIYAIGEIILVVIGILIALQINNWNEGRKEAKHEQAILSNLVEDLKADSASFEGNYIRLMEIDEVHRQLYNVIAQNTRGDELENAQYIRSLIWYNPIAKENDPFIASKISDESIRREIQKYFRALNNMNHIKEEFSTLTKSRLRPFLGEKELYSIHAHFRPDSIQTSWLDKDGLVAVAKQPEFQQILFESNLKLGEMKIRLRELMDQNEILKEKITLSITRSE